MQRNSGFSFVELLVVVAIVGLIMGAIYTVFQTSNRSYVVQDRVVGMQQDARFGVDYIADLLKMAGYDPRGTGSNTFGFQYSVTWDSNTIITGEATVSSVLVKSMAFTVDFDQDGAVAANDNEKVAFRLTTVSSTGVLQVNGTGVLQRYRNGTGWETILSGVDVANSSFSYIWDDTTAHLPASTDDMTKIRAVQVTLQMSAPQLYGKTLQQKSYTTQVKCRNLGLT
ncbi:MAG TPA: prepilin-type N-terminal cleavage/methylation domain-containing protein [Syntrophobacteria bacterium]|nr:prepilin-type N-terminal cleavage/methylation domain-containing protein [Syntrophobacteria bacterium]